MVKIINVLVAVKNKIRNFQQIINIKPFL